MINLEETKTGIAIQVLVVPKASQTGFSGIQDGALKIRVAAPPVEGRANREVVTFLSKILKVPSSRISIKTGEKSRLKKIEVEGISLCEARARLSGVKDGR